MIFRLSCIAALFAGLHARNDDRFNYRETVGRDYGPEDWNKVTCDDVGECLGWPDGWELGVGWELTGNNCESCPATGNNCGQHRQSPINLERNRGLPGHELELTCFDYHWMAYEDGACTWDDIVDNPTAERRHNFVIRRHALQILQPISKDGELQCENHRGRMFPRLDYSKGFPNWWHLSHTEITVPSEHTQEGKRYDAEVHLIHFYEIKHVRKAGKVAIFLEAVPGIRRWGFLDKLICQWREAEEATRAECGLPSVETEYPHCRNPRRDGTPSASPAPSPPPPPTPDPYPWIDCNKIDNPFRICKPTSCCEEKRHGGQYCRDIYERYENEIGSICWWCCPGKLVAPAEGEPTPSPTPLPTSLPTPNPTAPPTSPPSPRPTERDPMDGHDSDPPEQDVTVPPTTLQTPQPTPERTSKPSSQPSDQPSSQPSDQPTSQPSSLPSMQPTKEATVTPGGSPSPTFQCEDYPDTNFNRICKDGGCCDPIRSSTDHCHDEYAFFGDNMGEVCSKCCNPSRTLTPPPPEHHKYPPIDCSLIDNPFRICKPTSCCNAERTDNIYCNSVYEKYPGDLMGSICWYCCSEPKEVGPELTRRQLRGKAEEPFKLPSGRPEVALKMDDVNFIENDNLEEHYMDEIEMYRRTQEQELLIPPFLENYEQVEYKPYNWMREVKTEYYYRYEGTQAVPPCYERVHWRMMKDPIRVHPDQIKELERLLAQRIAPIDSEFNSCEPDTAGRERPGTNGEIRDFNRPLQSNHKLHYKVFCECKDWDSKFKEDRDWCEMDYQERFYEHPYNFDSDLFEI